MASVANETMTRCYLTAPANLPLGSLLALLEQRGIAVTREADNSPAGITATDFVIAVIGPPGTNHTVFFDIGYASALKKRCLLILPRAAEPLPQQLRGLPQVAAELDDRQAITFVLDLVRAAPRQATPTIGARDTSRPIGQERAEQFLTQLAGTDDEAALKTIVATALTLSEIMVVIADSDDDRRGRGDLGVWLDDLDSAVGNPLLIEVQRDLRQRAQLRMVQQQIARYLTDTHTRTALLLYLLGPTEEEEFLAFSTPNVLLLPIAELLARLGEQSFSAIIRDLRNRVAHRVAA